MSKFQYRSLIIIISLVSILYSCDQLLGPCSSVKCPNEGIFLKLENDSISLAEAAVLQNGEMVDAYIHEYDSQVSELFVHLSDNNDSIKVILADTTYDIKIEASYSKSKCCGNFLEIEQLSIGDSVLCQGVDCDNSLSLSLD
ncbi:hypothetical protein [Marinoscillum sp. MHG1-6]|uniref:hypothetical protein n=1 Tax=Marinoscillum sp. MHG1-6 TaxID=2959627 RepID=UPI002157771F|nr:hypothetical protein [Marinoscillum sp. MHG1-6]